ncbi:unnamed protein product [Linum trigynum]|uniref:Uncharacterized protein n=1 Tax=Linum trigynum TaxID=586398 RepID=A0AAV2FXQ8_9ROSI
MQSFPSAAKRRSSAEGEVEHTLASLHLSSSHLSGQKLASARRITSPRSGLLGRLITLSAKTASNRGPFIYQTLIGPTTAHPLTRRPIIAMRANLYRLLPILRQIFHQATRDPLRLHLRQLLQAQVAALQTSSKRMLPSGFEPAPVLNVQTL